MPSITNKSPGDTNAKRVNKRRRGEEVKRITGVRDSVRR